MTKSFDLDTGRVVEEMFQLAAREQGPITFHRGGSTFEVLPEAVANTLLFQPVAFAAVLKHMGIVLAVHDGAERVIGDALLSLLDDRGGSALDALGRIGGRR